MIFAFSRKLARLFYKKTAYFAQNDNVSVEKRLYMGFEWIKAKFPYICDTANHLNESLLHDFLFRIDFHWPDGRTGGDTGRHPIFGLCGDH